MASKVEIDVGVKSSAVTTGLAQIKAQFMQLRQSLNSDLGKAISIGGLVAGAVQVSRSLDRVKDLSDMFNESAESMQRADVAAKLFGSDIETVATAVSKVTVNALKAVRDGGQMAENFQQIGINAAEFVNLPLEDKLIALSAAYQRAQGSGVAMGEILSVLGARSKELIPLLSQGPEALRAAMDQAVVASQNAVDAVDTFYDRLIVLQQAAAAFFGIVIQGFLSIAAVIGASIGGMIGANQAMFGTLKNAWLQYGVVVRNVLTGNLAGARAAAAEFPKIFSEGLQRAANAVTGATSEIRDQWNDIWNKVPEQRVRGPVLEEEAEDVRKKRDEEAKKRGEEISRLQKQLSDQERDRVLRNMESEERINELYRERLLLQVQLSEQTDEKERLETQLKIADVNRDIDQTNKQRTDSQKSNDEELQNAQERLAELQRENVVDTLTPKEQLKSLRAEIEALDKQIKEALTPKAQIDLKITREERVRERAQIEERIKDERKSFKGVAADFLAEIGGGGRTGTGFDPIVYEQRRGNTILERIEQNTRTLATQTAPKEIMKP